MTPKPLLVGEPQDQPSLAVLREMQLPCAEAPPPPLGGLSSGSHMGLADPRSVPPQSSNWTRKGVSWQLRKKGLGGLVGWHQRPAVSTLVTRGHW